MIIVLLSGGSGKKLWPLSNDIRSKQFIKLFKNDTGESESMIQRVYHQVKDSFTDAKIIAATSKQQASTVITQLGEDIQLSLEPARKGTFPAVVLTVESLKLKQDITDDEIVLACPVDLFVETDFFKQIQDNIQTFKDNEIMMVGTKPMNASERYGYIIPETNESISKVSKFIDRVTFEEAKTLVNENALWSAGIYLLRVKDLLALAHEKINYSDYDDLFKEYKSIQSISLDEVAKESNDLYVLNSSEQLNDLGTWKAITRVMQSDVIGNAAVSETCKNVSIINDMDIPVFASGLNDVIISASQQGILVSKKEESIDIGENFETFNNPIMFADKSWGSLEVLDVSDESMTIKLHINAGKQMSYHSHEHRDEMWTILSGKGKTIVDGMEQPVQAGDVITMEAGCRHTIYAEEDLEVIEIQRGKDITVKDKKKFEME